MRSLKTVGGMDVGVMAALILLGTIALFIFLQMQLSLCGGELGVPLDDSWIHFQFARNLAEGNGFAFNPGEPTSGSTSPLWSVLLALLYAAGGSFPAAGQAMSAVSFLLSLPVTYVFAKKVTGACWAAGLAAAVVAVNGRAVWAGMSGLETPLFTTVSLLAIGAYLVDRHGGRFRATTAGLFGLAALLRPEGYLLFALAVADTLLVPAVVSPSARLTFWRRVPVIPVVIFGLIVSPYLLFSVTTSGRFLPNTFHAKAVVTLVPDMSFLAMAARYLVLDNVLLYPFFVLGLAWSLRRARLLGLWAIGLPVSYAFLHAVLYQHGRYLIPLIPCNAVLSVAGIVEARKLVLRSTCRVCAQLRRLYSSLSAGRNSRWLSACLLILTIGGTAWRLPLMAQLYAQNVDNINDMHVQIGHWVSEHTPSDAVIALNDIGAIAYLSHRTVVDLAGLVTPQVIPILKSPARDEAMLEYMATKNVSYVIIFPNWFPGIASSPGALTEVYRIVLANNTIAGGQEMVVYRAAWEG